MSKIIAGIDPGVKTGLAIWDCESKKFKTIETTSIIDAIFFLSNLVIIDDISEIWFEDSRLRKWYGNNSNSKAQGAGSVKRDCKIWQEFCEYYKIPFKAIAPAKGQTKWSSDYFKKLTGWTSRTSEHARDAAALVFGAK